VCHLLPFALRLRLEKPWAIHKAASWFFENTVSARLTVAFIKKTPGFGCIPFHILPKTAVKGQKWPQNRPHMGEIGRFSSHLYIYINGL
jgi:hypothetical protein